MKDHDAVADNVLDDDGGLQVVRGSERHEEFFRREFPAMVAVAYAMSGSRWAAEEAAQEALLRAYRSWETVGRYDKPGAWLRRVTINLATSWMRRRISEVPLCDSGGKHPLWRMDQYAET